MTDNYPLQEHHTTVSPDERGRVNLRKYLERHESTGEIVDYRVHLYDDGAILLRPVKPGGVR